MTSQKFQQFKTVQNFGRKLGLYLGGSSGSIVSGWIRKENQDHSKGHCSNLGRNEENLN